MVDIKSVDQYAAAHKQAIVYRRTTSRTSVAAGWFSLFDVAGSPGPGTLAGTNTANGIVPVAGNTGYPVIGAFGGGAIGRVTKIDFGSSVACRIRLYDRLFVAGAYAFNANTALSAQPSFSARCNLRDPATDTDAINYRNTEIWIEQVTAATGNQAVNVTYTDQDGNAGATTGAVGIGAAPTVGRCWPLPLAAGDSGVQLIQNVTGTVATAGTFNVMVLRKLWEGRVRIANDGDVHDLLRTGMRQAFATSALYPLIAADSTSTGIPDMEIEISDA